MTRVLVGSFCCTIAILVVWCGYVSWDRDSGSDMAEERPVAYMNPRDPFEEIPESDHDFGNPRGQSRSFRPPVLMAMRRFFQIS